MATSRQIRRWIFVSRSRTVARAFLSCLVCSFTLVYFATFSDNFENGSNWENKNLIISHQVKQRNLKSARFLAPIKNEKSYQLNPNDSPSSSIYVKKKFRELCPFVSPLLGKQRIVPSPSVKWINLSIAVIKLDGRTSRWWHPPVARKVKRHSTRECRRLGWHLAEDLNRVIAKLEIKWPSSSLIEIENFIWKFSYATCIPSCNDNNLNTPSSS